MNDADFPVTSSVVQLMSADKKVSADTLQSVTKIVRELEEEAKASVFAAAKHYGRKAADAKRKKLKRRAAAQKPDISILPFIDSDSKKVRKRPAFEKTGDLFGSRHNDDWPEGFDVLFWDAWPKHPRKHSQKQVAIKLARIRRDGGIKVGSKIIAVTWAQIWAGLTGYIASKPEHKFIPAPLVWVNQARWTADHSPQRPAKMTLGDIMRGGIARHG